MVNPFVCFIVGLTMKRILGIDLGTTNSVAAFMDEAGPRLVPKVTELLVVIA